MSDSLKTADGADHGQACPMQACEPSSQPPLGNEHGDPPMVDDDHDDPLSWHHFRNANGPIGPMGLSIAKFDDPGLSIYPGFFRDAHMLLTSNARRVDEFSRRFRRLYLDSIASGSTNMFFPGRDKRGKELRKAEKRMRRELLDFYHLLDATEKALNREEPSQRSVDNLARMAERASGNTYDDMFGHPWARNFRLLGDQEPGVSALSSLTNCCLTRWLLAPFREKNDGGDPGSAQSWNARWFGLIWSVLIIFFSAAFLIVPLALMFLEDIKKEVAVPLCLGLALILTIAVALKWRRYPLYNKFLVVLAYMALIMSCLSNWIQ